MSDESMLASGLIERIGEKEGLIKCILHPETDKEQIVKRVEAVADHKRGMHRAVEILTDPDTGVIGSSGDVSAVGHRVVHGEKISTCRRLLRTMFSRLLKKIFPWLLFIIQQILMASG